ncbi:YrdB family protein, partial [Modestobacter altitudinis]|uniref:YrdB family protein n=1 Tax=Modestobacter altitudinis TaxID=2213158 RepID=UPI00110D18B0
GWQLGGPVAVRALLAVALPVAAGVLWSQFAAPRAAHPSVAGRLAVQVLVFGAAAVLLAWGAAPCWGAAFAVVVAANLVAAAVLPSVGSHTA